MPKKIDLTGKIFGRLTVIKEAANHLQGIKPKTKWLCKCMCGNYKEIQTDSLRRNKTTSCGCYQKEQTTKHNDSSSKEYNAWFHAKNRCNNPLDPGYPNYGGRGITICPEWLNSYEQFLADVGRAPSPEYSIDRIDNNGNYEPNNVRWTKKTIQAINKRINPHNKSGYTGVSWNKKINKWIATITINKKAKHLGCFNNINDAINARKSAEETYYKPLLNNK